MQDICAANTQIHFQLPVLGLIHAATGRRHPTFSRRCSQNPAGWSPPSDTFVAWNRPPPCAPKEAGPLIVAYPATCHPPPAHPPRFPPVQT
jgi:hypothetical protein